MIDILYTNFWEIHSQTGRQRNSSSVGIRENWNWDVRPGRKLRSEAEVTSRQIHFPRLAFISLCYLQLQTINSKVLS